MPWYDCPYYENCLGSCEYCNIKGNPMYSSIRKDESNSDIVKEVILKNWFNNSQQKQ